MSFRIMRRKVTERMERVSRPSSILQSIIKILLNSSLKKKQNLIRVIYKGTRINTKHTGEETGTKKCILQGAFLKAEATKPTAFLKYLHHERQKKNQFLDIGIQN